MCYAYTFRHSQNGLAGFFRIMRDGRLVNVGSTNPRPFITPGSFAVYGAHGPNLIDSTWGRTFKGKLIYNARSDKLLTSSFWKEAFQLRRCLIPADGWYDLHQELPQGTTLSKYEAKQQGLTRNGKRQYFFHLPDEPCFAMAGIYGKGVVKGETVDCFMVITTDASDSIKHLHHRMPALVDRQYFDDYLSPDIPAVEAHQMISPYDQEIIYRPQPGPVSDDYLNWPSGYTLSF